MMTRWQWLLAGAAAISIVTGNWWLAGIATGCCIADGFVETVDEED
jgi:hypothetical protein